MGTRIDDLEKSIGELMEQAGVEPVGEKEMIDGGGGKEMPSALCWQVRD